MKNKLPICNPSGGIICCKKKDKKYSLLLRHIQEELLSGGKYRVDGYGDIDYKESEVWCHDGNIKTYFEFIACRHTLVCKNKFIGGQYASACYCSCNKEI